MKTHIKKVCEPKSDNRSHPRIKFLTSIVPSKLPMCAGPLEAGNNIKRCNNIVPGARLAIKYEAVATLSRAGQPPMHQKRRRRPQSQRVRGRRAPTGGGTRLRTEWDRTICAIAFWNFGAATVQCILSAPQGPESMHCTVLV